MPAAHPKGRIPPTLPAQVRLVVEAIRDRYAPERIILFGSHAWGTPHADSDVDLLIVKRTDARPLQRCIDVRQLIRNERRRLPLDLLVYTPEELDLRLAQGDTFLQEILRRGVVVHA